MMSQFAYDVTVFGCCPEYQLESESLSQCELLRGVAVAKQQGDTPHCMEDGRFRWAATEQRQELIQNH